MDYGKPQITLERDARTNTSRWVLTLQIKIGGGDYLTYELRVRHHFPEDSVSFYRLDDGDEVLLVSHEERDDMRDSIIEHEGCGPCMTDGCNNPLGASVAIGGIEGVMAPHHVCEDCKTAFSTGLYTHTPLDRRDALSRAQVALDAKGVRTARAGELAIRAHLQRTWDAFTFLFNPSTTL